MEGGRGGRGETRLKALLPIMDEVEEGALLGAVVEGALALAEVVVVVVAVG